jgi:Fumarylacetoacetate (FAA) hydrolase family
MRLVSYKRSKGDEWGVLLEGGVVPSARLGKDLPASLQDLLSDQQAWPGLVGDLPRRAAQAAPVALDDVTLLPCIPRPGKVICLGVNYIDHAKEGGNQIGDYPAMFLRCATSLLAHRAPLRVSWVSSKLDFEAELAVVIGALRAMSARTTHWALYSAMPVSTTRRFATTSARRHSGPSARTSIRPVLLVRAWSPPMNCPRAASGCAFSRV